MNWLVFMGFILTMASISGIAIGVAFLAEAYGVWVAGVFFVVLILAAATFIGLNI